MDPTTDALDDILKRWLPENPDIQGAAVISNEGLPIASAFPLGVDETRVAAISAAIVKTSLCGVQELSRGALKRIIIEGEQGNVIITEAGKNVILVVIVKKGYHGFSMDGFFNTRVVFNPPGSPGATASAEKEL
jgi:predicted regulator of Ras-like GTPase activity (Roadblock/LC7/MglB family)